MAAWDLAENEEVRAVMVIAVLSCVVCVAKVVLACLLGGWGTWWVLRPSPPPVDATHPYARPSIFYPLKVLVFYCLIKYRKRTAGSGESAGYGSKSHNNEEQMECPQPLHPNPKAINAVFFSGAAEGWGIILAMERRPNRLTSVVVYLKVPNTGLLVPLSHPDTVTFREKDEEEIFSAGGLRITPIVPMKSWNVQYTGRLRLYDKPDDHPREAEIDLMWSSDLPHFDYDTDMDPMTMAKAFAREPWSREYFQNLKEHHQTHYEQMGFLQGTVKLNGRSHSIRLPAFRDHSYSKLRDWRLMHRYVFHHIFLENGCKGMVGVVCQPSTCSRLILGNWWTAAGQCEAVTHVDLDLKQHGEGGTPPTDYAFIFTAGGQEYMVEVEAEFSPTHYLGWDWEARMVNAMVKYKVNGVQGAGIGDWNYRHKGGRPEELNGKDPEWVVKYRSEYLAA